MMKAMRFCRSTSFAALLVMSCGDGARPFGDNVIDGGSNDKLRIDSDSGSDRQSTGNSDGANSGDARTDDGITTTGRDTGTGGTTADSVGDGDTSAVCAGVTVANTVICRPATCSAGKTTPQGYCTDHGTCKIWKAVTCPGQCDAAQTMCWITDALGSHTYWGPMPGFAECISPACEEQ